MRLPTEELFPSDKEKNEAVNSLRTLVRSKGWKVLTKLLDFDINKIDNELRVKEFEDVNELKRMQDSRATRQLLKEYPEEIIRTLSRDQSEKVELDPYQDHYKPSINMEEAN